MRTLVLYRPVSEHATMVEGYLRDFTTQTSKELEAIDVDSPEGVELCKLYDIVEYPAILAMDEDGRLQNAWVGSHLPTISEVSYYAGQGPART